MDCSNGADRTDFDLSRKVFGLGLARTGTTSLHQAMLHLGLRSAPDSIPLVDGMDHSFLTRFDAFFDNPIPFCYEALDRVCPDSRWIVTERPVDDWIESMRWLFGPGLDRLDPHTRSIGDHVHRVVYGTDTFDAARLRAIHTRHYSELRTWIADRPHVWIDMTRGITWEPICTLLDYRVPREPFPWANPR